MWPAHHANTTTQGARQSSSEWLTAAHLKLAGWRYVVIRCFLCKGPGGCTLCCPTPCQPVGPIVWQGGRMSTTMLFATPHVHCCFQPLVHVNFVGTAWAAPGQALAVLCCAHPYVGGHVLHAVTLALGDWAGRPAEKSQETFLLLRRLSLPSAHAEADTGICVATHCNALDS